MGGGGWAGVGKGRGGVLAPVRPNQMAGARAGFVSLAAVDILIPTFTFEVQLSSTSETLLTLPGSLSKMSVSFPPGAFGRRRAGPPAISSS